MLTPSRMASMSQPRTLVWFSAGAASAVAAKLTLKNFSDLGEIVIAYTDPGSEHPDNVRFIDQCEEWFGHPVTRLKSEKFADTWEVWEKRRFIVSAFGAPCTTELKKKVRYSFEKPTDRQVFGYTVEEKHRAERFRDQNPGVDLVTPLIDFGLTKSDCLAMIARAGIELPVMYSLGYQNNNCIGCPKGGMGYWNKIRIDFPETFDRMAKLERDIGNSVLRSDGEKLFLDELDPARGNHATEASFECSLLCAIAETEYEDDSR
jgi:3'-phosphoadenosine 5'-phosphosulfate sulfotransferase (PAPS reductase)/FAD synthetase